ncbi:MAG: alpha/beta hydrolase [Sandaracinaceae bacterium]|nr:alpha/beta hydrolase [Sandaracinaceae bacterium]
MAIPAHTIVQADGSTPTRSLLFLHGILGTRANWRGVARKLVDERPELAAVLVDLRGHGDSLGLPGAPTIAEAARDLVALEAVLAAPVRGVLGHSFGGKVAMQYASDRSDPLDALIVVDSSPGRERAPDAPATRSGATEPARVQETAQILRTLRDLSFPVASREAFVSAIEAAGLSRPIALWLAMNLRRTPAGERDFPLDLDEVEALLASYYDTDTWAAVERPRGRGQVHMIVGGRSSVLSAADVARIELATREHDGVHLHVVPEAGHWVHVDAPDALHELLLVATRSLGR